MAECHPVGFQWVMEAQASAAPRSSTSTPGSPAPARWPTCTCRCAPAPTSPSSAASSTTSSRTASSSASTSRLHERGGDRQRGLRRHRGPRRAVLRLRPRDRDLRHRDSWQYEGMEVGASAGQREMREAYRRAGPRRARRRTGARQRAARTTMTLEHPRCVFQMLKRHFSRYTPEMVARDLRRAARRPSSRSPRRSAQNSGRERTSAFCYAVGWTQHTVGVQYIRTAAIMQLLLGNIGRPGGGILALRGHASIQGSTDIPTLFNILPGYLPMPHAHAHSEPRRLPRAELGRRPATGATWTPYMVSLLKAWWGDAATRGERLLLRLPAADRRRPLRTTPSSLDMLDGKLEGFFLIGENPAVGSANSRLQRLGARQPELAGRARLPGDRERRLLARRPGDRDRASSSPRRSAPRSSSCPPPRTSRRTAASPTPSGCCSGTTRRSSRPATPARDLWFTYHLGLQDPREAGRPRKDPRTGRSST